MDKAKDCALVKDCNEAGTCEVVTCKTNFDTCYEARGMFSGQVVKYRACGKKPSANLDGNNCEDFQYADPSVTDVKKCYCEGDKCNSNLSPDSSVPWWVYLLVVLGILAIAAIIAGIVLWMKKRSGKKNSDMIMENKEETPKPADAEDPLLKTTETDPETK